MKQHKFDIIMDYIDENIKSDTETIKKGIYNLYGITSRSFGEVLKFFTGDTLGLYIHKRKLYYAVIDLQVEKEKEIIDIGFDYGYSDQSSFTRAITTQYGFSPRELRKNTATCLIKDNKYYFDKFQIDYTDSRSKRILRILEQDGDISDYNLDFIESIDEGRKEYGFDIDTCYAIADLAERLEIPVDVLMKNCFELVVDIKSDSNYFSEKIEVAIDLGIYSDEDLEKICEHYSCKYYELNEHMVKEYYDMFA
jgi:AraC-like DNA-binding protein